MIWEIEVFCFYIVLLVTLKCSPTVPLAVTYKLIKLNNTE